MADDSNAAYSVEAMMKIIHGPAAQRRSDHNYYDPRPQNIYAFSDGKWRTFPPTEQSGVDDHLSELRIITWNVDFLIPFARPRMDAALKYLESLIKDPSPPVAIFLQEMTASDLQQIRDAPWVQERFYITDPEGTNWLTSDSGLPYGTTMLVDLRLTIKRVFRVPVLSKFDRDGLFVDVQAPGTGKVVRLCNVHLESLPANPPVRDKQLADLRPYMHEEGVSAALLAGDCNAIEPFDRTLHTENGLKDAYLELGGKEDSDEGYTWGYQETEASKGKFPPSRMDKLMYCGNIHAKGLERMGVGVSVGDEGTKAQMTEKLGCDWVTDHYGLDVILGL